MLDLEFILANVEAVRRNCCNRNVPGDVLEDLDRLVALEGERKALLREVESVRRRQNEVAQATGREKDAARRQELVIERKRLKAERTASEDRLCQMKADLKRLLGRIPNMTHPDAPVGATEDESRELPKVGEEKIMAGTLPRATARTGDTPSPEGAGSRDHDLPAELIEPAWLGGGDNSPTGEVARRLWLERLEKDPWGSIDLHPGWALDPRAMAGKAPVVYARWDGEHGEAASLSSLAMLQVRAIHVQPIPGVPWRVTLRGLNLVGSRVLGDNGPASLAAFIGAVTQLLAVGDADCVLIQDLELGSPLWDALDEAGRGHDVAIFHLRRPQPHWWIDFPEVPRDYWKKFSGRTRCRLRQKSDKIEGSVVRFTEKREVSTLLEKSHHVSLRSWQNRRLGWLRNNSSEERMYFEFAASCGALRSYILEREGRPCAFMLGIQWKGCFTLLNCEYDAADAKYGPGTVLLFRVLEDCIAHDTPRFFDFGPGDYDYKQLFGGRHTYSGRVLVVRRSWWPMITSGLDQFRCEVHQGLRDYLRNLGMLHNIKTIYHNLPGFIRF